MSVTIRLMREDDRAAIAALQTASWQNAYAGYLSSDELAALPDKFALKWQSHASGPGDLVVVAEDKGDFVGFAAFLAGDPMFLDNLHVRPDLRRGGVGRALLAGCVAPLAELSASRAELTVVEANTAARAFYARMGGQIVAQEVSSALGVALPVLRIRWNDVSVWERLAQPGATGL